jgi:hypothetical protein
VPGRPDKGFPLEGFSLDKCKYARVDPLGGPNRDKIEIYIIRDHIDSEEPLLYLPGGKLCLRSARPIFFCRFARLSCSCDTGTCTCASVAFLAPSYDSTRGNGKSSPCSPFYVESHAATGRHWYEVPFTFTKTAIIMFHIELVYWYIKVS